MIAPLRTVGKSRLFSWEDYYRTMARRTVADIRRGRDVREFTKRTESDKHRVDCVAKRVYEQ